MTKKQLPFTWYLYGFDNKLIKEVDVATHDQESEDYIRHAMKTWKRVKLIEVLKNKGGIVFSLEKP